MTLTTMRQFVLLAACHAAALMGQQVVTLCGNDTQPGAGVNFAAAMRAGGVIGFSCGPQATVHLTQAYTISRRTVLSASSGVLTLDVPATGAPLSMFHITNGAELLIQNITLHNPVTLIAEIDSGQSGKVTLQSCKVTASANGFALNDGTFSAIGTQFTNGSGYIIHARTVNFDGSEVSSSGVPIVSSGGAVEISNSSFVTSGPVVCLNGQLTVTNVQFAGMSAAGQSLVIPGGHSTPGQQLHLNDGGAISTSCVTTIKHSVFRNNKATNGGAIAASGASLAINDSQFYSNAASSHGGAILYSAAAPPATHTFAIQYGIFSQNTADYGGAMDLGADLNGAAISFSRNSATHDGGALRVTDASVGLAQGSFTDNHAGGIGGAVALSHSVQKTVEFANSLFIRNAAGATGGSAFSGSIAQFFNSTLAANPGLAITVPAGLAPAPWRIISLVNSIVSNNGTNCAISGGSAQLIDSGHNLQFPGNACGASIRTVDPALDSMYIPTPGSPAYGNGDNSVCTGTAVNKIDLFGQQRPRMNTCTIGAIEGEIETQVRKMPDFNHQIPPTGIDFSLSISPLQQFVAAGSTATFTVTESEPLDLHVKVAYSVGGLPAGASATVNATSETTSAITIATSSTTPPGTYALVVTGTSGGLIHKVRFSLFVHGPGA